MVREVGGVVNKLLTVRDLFDGLKQSLAFIFRILILSVDHFNKLPPKFMISFRDAIEDQLTVPLQFMKLLLLMAFRERNYVHIPGVRQVSMEPVYPIGIG